MMCPASRTLLAAAMAGMVVSSILANDTAGWIAADTVGVIVHLFQRRRPELASCALSTDRTQRADTRPAGADTGQTTGPAQRSASGDAGPTHITPER